MKRKIWSLAFLCLAFQGFAQQPLREMIKGENGSTKAMLTLDASHRISFNPNNAKTILGLEPASDLVLLKTEKDELGNTIYRYLQTYQNIPIENSMYIAGVKGNYLKEVNGKIVLEFSNQFRTVTPSVDAEQAIKKAMHKVSAELYAWQDQEFEDRIKKQLKDDHASFLPKATLVWYNPSEEVNPEGMQLCFKVDLYARQPLSRAEYFVSATTGEILGQHDKIHFVAVKSGAQTTYSGLRKIYAEYDGTELRLRDYTKGDGVITVHGESGRRGEDYISKTQIWSFDNEDKAALDAHYGVSQTYSFFWENFGRNSYDGNGTALYNYVNDSKYFDNAYWDGTAMYFNKRYDGGLGGVTGIDVTGHELTHGLTQATSGLIYSKESGAINESMSDIFGKLVQFWSKPDDINWLLSNDMSWIIRDMSNPKYCLQPDTYMGKYWQKGKILDNGGVHTNSGVGNYLFYLLVNGGSGKNDNGDKYDVQGIGMKKAAKIIYRTNTVKLTPSSQYIDWRDACISAATDLFGENSPVISEVKNAWYAVGIGEPGTQRIMREVPTKTAAVSISPNPISGGAAQISYTLLTDGKVSLKVLNLNGSLMSNIELGQKMKGPHSYRLSVTNMPKGNYVLVLEQNGVIVSRTNFLISR